MKTLKKTTYVILLTFITNLAGCSSDDNNSGPDGDPGDPTGQQGDPHTYDITITGGSAGEKNVSGEIDNSYTEGITNLSIYEILEDGTKAKSFFLGNSEISIIGSFYEVNGQTPDFGSEGDKASELSIILSPPIEDGYEAISGSVELSNINYKTVTTTSGLASYKLIFNGTFETDEGDETVQVSGTVVVHMPPSLN